VEVHFLKMKSTVILISFVSLLSTLIFSPLFYDTKIESSENLKNDYVKHNSDNTKQLFPSKEFKKYSQNPILIPQGDGFESKATFNPCTILKNDTIYMLYRAQDEKLCSTIGLAWSIDGVNFNRLKKPVIKPEFDYEIPGGCEDPRVVKIGNTYYVTYTGYNLKETPSCLAASKDLKYWKKYGIITPDKSAAIINIEINGKYWLYFGDTNIWAAYSTDLVQWRIIDEPVLKPRKNKFDEALVEPGPPPIITNEGILLIYNGNIPRARAEKLGEKVGRKKVREYATGWALFATDDPTKLIARCEEPFLTVTEKYEIQGLGSDVVFSEGLIKKNGKSYLYYGCADTYVGVAISDQIWNEPMFIRQSNYIQKINKRILTPQGNGFEQKRVYNPTAIVEGETIYLIYRAEGIGTGTGVFGLAESSDGIHFQKYNKNPIIVPKYDFEKDGCEDPRIVKFGALYYLFYAGNEKRTPGNMCLATSSNLIQWNKYGEILQPQNDWEIRQIKAPAPVPGRINNKYWMYYQGEERPWHTAMGIAYSKELIHWTQLSDEPIMRPRKDHFDSKGTEPGVAVIIEKGILLIYSGWGGDGTNINKLGWALFSKDDPAKLLNRCEHPFISLPHDHVFAEGLVKFKDKWYLYYGVADQWIESVILNIDQMIE